MEKRCRSWVKRQTLYKCDLCTVQHANKYKGHRILLYKWKIWTKSVEQSPSSQAKFSSPRQVIPHNIWKTKVRDSFHNNPPLVHILSYINPIYAITSYFLSTHILPPTPRHYNWSLPFKSTTTKSCLHLFSPNVPHALPISLSFIYHPLKKGWGTEDTKFFLM